MGGPRDSSRRIRLFGEKPAHTVHVVNNFNFNFNFNMEDFEIERAIMLPMLPRSR
jgi:hypothetical protein